MIRQRLMTGRAGLVLVAILFMGGSTVATRAMPQGDKTAVIVNGEIITEQDFFERLQRMHAQSFLAGKDQLRGESAGQLILDSMITERLTLQAANKANVALSDTETATELADLKKQPQVLSGLATHQFTEEMLKYDIRVRGARFKLATAGVSVTSEEVQNYYKAHSTEYTTPEQWGVSVIRTANLDTLAKIDADLKSGKSFAETAKLYSEDTSTKDKGGDIGTMAANEPRLAAAIRDALRPLKVGEVSPAVKIEQDLGPGKAKLVTWWRLLMRTKEPEMVHTFDELKRGLERLALIEKAGGLQTADKKIAAFRSQSEVKVSMSGYENLEVHK